MNFGLNSIYRRILARVAAEKRWKKAWFIPSITFWPHRSPSLLSPKNSFSAIQKLSGSKWWIRLKYIKGQTLPFSPTTSRPSPHPMNGLHWNALKWWLNRTNVAVLKWMNEKIHSLPSDLFVLNCSRQRAEILLGQAPIFRAMDHCSADFWHPLTFFHFVEAFLAPTGTRPQKRSRRRITSDPKYLTIIFLGHQVHALSGPRLAHFCLTGTLLTLTILKSD